jgi:hypothetical protein
MKSLNNPSQKVDEKSFSRKKVKAREVKTRHNGMVSMNQFGG